MARFLCAVLTAVRLPIVPVALLGVLAAACSSETDQPRPMHIAAQVVDDTVTLAVSEIPPSRQITALVLVDATGNETPARERELITREEGSGGNAGPGVGVGASGGSSSGIRPYISLGYLFRGDDSTRRSQHLTAAIPLNDPAAYAAGYRDWRIVVRYRDQLGEPQQVAIPAPAP